MTTWLPTPAAFAPATRPGHGPGPDPRVERILRRWLALGIAAVVLVPAMRGSSEWFGWWPLWLVGMPAVAWWAVCRFRLPRLARLALLARTLRPHRQARMRQAPARPAPACAARA